MKFLSQNMPGIEPSTLRLRAKPSTNLTKRFHAPINPVTTPSLRLMTCCISLLQNIINAILPHEPTTLSTRHTNVWAALSQLWVLGPDVRHPWEPSVQTVTTVFTVLCPLLNYCTRNMLEAMTCPPRFLQWHLCVKSRLKCSPIRSNLPSAIIQKT